MTTINMRDFYPWYTQDEYIEVSDDVAAELLEDKRYQKAYRRRVYRNKAQYSIDCDDGIEYSACYAEPSPHELMEQMHRFEQMCHALNSLSDAQGQRVYEHFILDLSPEAIAAQDGVSKSAVTAAIRRGLESMKKYLGKSL